MTTVRVETRGAAVVVTITRPERSNALDRATVRELGRVGRELAADSAVRATLLTGAGERVFSAGADLKERSTLSDEEVREVLNLYRSELAWLGASPFPVVAAINGTALGGGLELALACDLRVAVETASLGLPETSLGIIPAAGGTQRLPRLVGYAKAAELVLLGTRLTASEAYAVGLVNRVSPPGSNVVEDALSWLAPLLEGAPIATRAALTALRASSTLSLAEGLELELREYETCLVSEDRREALRAFSERRKPIFRGR